MNNNDLQKLIDLPSGEQIPDDYGREQQTQQRKLRESTIQNWQSEALEYINVFEAPITNWGEYEWVRTMAEFAYLKNEALVKELQERREFCESFEFFVTHGDKLAIEHCGDGWMYHDGADGKTGELNGKSGFESAFEAWQNAKPEGRL